MVFQYPKNLTIGMLWPDDPEFLATVHPHWRNFPVPDPIYNYLIGTYIGVVGIVAAIGNLLVLSLFALTRGLRSPPNVLIMNLAISDFSFSITIGFPVKTIAAFNQRWSWGKTACEIYGFLGGLFGFVSLTTMAFIALDRYFVIAQPCQACSRSGYAKVFVMIIFIWIWALLWSIPPFFGFGYYIAEGFHTSCTFDYLSHDIKNLMFNAGMYIMVFSAAVMVIIFCYAQIVRTVRNNEIQLQKMAQTLNSENPTSMKSTDKKADIEAAKTSAILVMLFLMSWCPYASVCLMSLLGYVEYMTPLMAELCVVFAKSSAVYNPFVYAIKHPKFRAELEKYFPGLFCCCTLQSKAKGKETTVTKVDVSAANTEAKP